jgi:hypothetical protein
MSKFFHFFLTLLFVGFCFQTTHAQVNSVTFGKNRVQYKKRNWQYYQSDRFQVYFYEGGQELAKYVLQLAEKEMPKLEKETEYNIQRRTNILVYNNFTDFRQSNVGLNTDLLNTGSTTKLVNNKMLVYFDGDHIHLKRQVRAGLADVITKNMLFGDDLGEVAGNQALLDLPEWLTEGYTRYLAEHWNTELDDQLKAEILSEKYKRFSSFCYRMPALAGHAFWFFIEEKYKKENVVFFMHLARSYKNLDKASQVLSRKKFKALTAEFMTHQLDKYDEDMLRRRAFSKGNFIEGFDVAPRLNYFRFHVNPNKRNKNYAVSEYRKGIVRVQLRDDDGHTNILKYGIRSTERELHPNYPLLAWDPKGVRLSIIYAHQGRLYIQLFDAVSKSKKWEIDITNQIDEVQDVKYMLDNRTLLLSAVKNGHTDIFTYDLEKEKLRRITDDVYDDLDATFVSFPNKTGILFSSNRPTATAASKDTVLPGTNRYNIFMVTNFGDRTEMNQITQLTDMKIGDARFPAPYNANHFTFISDENGIGNRYAGFFSTRNLGLDTFMVVSGDLLRNPTKADLDSLLAYHGKTEVDSIRYVSMTADSTYTFPLTNYESSVLETQTSGDDRTLSEVTRSGDEKRLYKLKLDQNALTRRNVNPLPTHYAKQRLRESKRAGERNTGTTTRIVDARQEAASFQTEFEAELEQNPLGTTLTSKPVGDDPSAVLNRSTLFVYKPGRYSADFGSANFNTTVLYNRYQPYGGGSGPVMLSSNSPLNGLITMGASDLMEDKRIFGGFKIGTNLKDNEWFVNYQNIRRRVDWGATYYRNVLGTGANLLNESGSVVATYPAKLLTNLYQGNVTYPFDESRSIRFTTGIRSDYLAVLNVDQLSAKIESQRSLYSLTRIEYVYDNTLPRMQNIMDGLRYKLFLDWNRQVKGKVADIGPTMFNVGFDARYYRPIFRDMIWATRFAGDFSWGSQKFIYYLGGMDGWLMFGDNVKPGSSRERFFNSSNKPASDVPYSFQSLALNMRGHIQNTANGNNAVVINSEIRMPVLSTLFDKTVNSAFLKNLMLTSFIDLGTAWTGMARSIQRPTTTFNDPTALPNGQVLPGQVTVSVKTGGLGPFAGGYGFGARSMLLGYYLKYDIGWPMTGIFKDRPVMYLSLGLDF